MRAAAKPRRSARRPRTVLRLIRPSRRRTLGPVIAFTRVDSVEETESGLRARLHGEWLRVDVLRADVVRLKISRGGAFDEQPTFAVVGELEGAEFTLQRDADVVRLTTSALVVTLGLEPF